MTLCSFSHSCLTFLLHDQHLTLVHLLPDCRGVLNQIKDLGITCWWKYLCTTICTWLFSAFVHSTMAGVVPVAQSREHCICIKCHSSSAGFFVGWVWETCGLAIAERMVIKAIESFPIHLTGSIQNPQFPPSQELEFEADSSIYIAVIFSPS